MPAKPSPMRSEATGTSGHGSMPRAIATVSAPIIARWKGSQSTRERAGKKVSAPSAGRNTRT